MNDHGIYAYSFEGGVEITTNGAITSDTREGIQVSHCGVDGAINITANAAVTAEDQAISVYSSMATMSNKHSLSK